MSLSDSNWKFYATIMLIVCDEKISNENVVGERHHATQTEIQTMNANFIISFSLTSHYIEFASPMLDDDNKRQQDIEKHDLNEETISLF